MSALTQAEQHARRRAAQRSGLDGSMSELMDGLDIYASDEADSTLTASAKLRVRTGGFELQVNENATATAANTAPTLQLVSPLTTTTDVALRGARVFPAAGSIGTVPAANRVTTTATTYQMLASELNGGEALYTVSNGSSSALTLPTVANLVAAINGGLTTTLTSAQLLGAYGTAFVYNLGAGAMSALTGNTGWTVISGSALTFAQNTCAVIKWRLTSSTAGEIFISKM
jgi:hypothetical protein